MQPVPPPPLNAEFFAEKLFKQQQKRNSVRAICAGGAATGVVDFVHIQLTSRRPTAYGHEFRDAAGVWTHVWPTAWGQWTPPEAARPGVKARASGSPVRWFVRSLPAAAITSLAAAHVTCCLAPWPAAQHVQNFGRSHGHDRPVGDRVRVPHQPCQAPDAPWGARAEGLLAPGGPSPSGGGAIDSDFSDALCSLLAMRPSLLAQLLILQQNNNSFYFFVDFCGIKYFFFVIGVLNYSLWWIQKKSTDIFNKFPSTYGHFAAHISCLCCPVVESTILYSVACSKSCIFSSPLHHRNFVLSFFHLKVFQYAVVNIFHLHPLIF